ncbi:radical SAM protein [Aeoliella sp. SH292]|uniref:radical SAM protein n=1 Tax=Aeoliella sp. SH292 TaxID=3454464 RepID=UPI003F9E67F1
MYPAFNLTLVVNHACNLRCRYCYTGDKFHRAMPPEVARRSIDRAVASLDCEGVLELDFFGGEPLLEAAAISDWIAYARSRTQAAGTHLRLGMTTNGTICDPIAWSVMMGPGLMLHVSCDGSPQVHDLHRIDKRGRGTSELVVRNIERLIDAGREVRAVMVIRPDTAQHFAAGLSFLRQIGVAHVTPSLDVWSSWSRSDAAVLATAVAEAADVWAESLTHFSVSWFDEKAASLLNTSIAGRTGRCGFGRGQIAVAPSGNLYPCERLVGEDRADNTARLGGTAMDGEDFLNIEAPDGPLHSGCSGCELQPQCSTSCRCNNYLRTGDVRRPDGLLCLLDQVCFRETRRVLEQLIHQQHELVTG